MTHSRTASRPKTLAMIAVAAVAGTFAFFGLQVPGNGIAAGGMVDSTTWREWATGGLQIGNPDRSRVTVVQFCDLTCGNCASLAAQLDSIRREFPDIAVVYRHAILVPDRLTMAGALMLTCAGRFRRFEDAYRGIFAAPPRGSETEDFIDFAKRLDLPWQSFVDCIDDGAIHREVAADRDLAASIGVTVTPVFLVNGRVMVGTPPLERLREVIAKAHDSTRTIH